MKRPFNAVAWAGVLIMCASLVLPWAREEPRHPVFGNARTVWVFSDPVLATGVLVVIVLCSASLAVSSRRQKRWAWGLSAAIGVLSIGVAWIFREIAGWGDLFGDFSGEALVGSALMLIGAVVFTVGATISAVISGPGANPAPEAEER